MPLLVTWHVLATSLALGQVTVVFRDGQSPTPAYAGTRDATLHDGTDVPWQPDAGYDNLDDFVGGGADRASTLLKFDLSSVPPATVISGAVVQLRVTLEAPGQTFNLYQSLQPWTSTGATWNLYDGASPWTGPGATGPGDLGLAMGTFSPATQGPGTALLSDAGVALVQGWISSPATNNGFILQSYTATATAVMHPFNSGSFVNWPQLLLGVVDGGTLVVDAGWDTTIANARDPRTVNDNTDHLVADGRPAAATLLAFDVSQVPPWSTVTAASIALDCASDGTALSYPVYASSRPWVEAQACWNTYATGTPWATPGADGAGDHGATALGTLTGVGAPITVALNAAGAQVVQDWIRGLSPNRGFQISDYTVGSDGIRCHAREEITVSERPALSVTYLEGQLAFPGAAAAGGVGTPLGPFALERRRLDGVSIASGAPALPVTVASSSVSAGFATDAGASTWSPALTITIPAGASASGSFWLRDTDAGRPAILLSAGLPWQPAQQVQSVRRVRFAQVPGTAVPVNGSAVLTIQAIDSVDVTVPVGLSARLLLVDGGTPAGATFRATTIGTPGTAQVSGVASNGAATLTVTDSRAEPIRVCGSISSAPASEACTSVTFAALDHLRLSLVGPGTTSPLEGCSPETIRVQMEDAMNNPVASPSQVTICALPDAGLVRGPSTLAGETRTVGCVAGTLGPDGSATLELAPTFPVGLFIGAASPDVPTGDAQMAVEWIAAAPSPTATTLEPRDAPGPITMQVEHGISWVRFAPRDACGFSATARSADVVLLIPDEVAVGPQYVDSDAGAIDFPIQLAVCPPGAAPISIRGRIFNQPLVDGSGAERIVTIVPQCGAPLVEVGCDCGAGPRSGQGTAALALFALTLRVAWRRRRPRSAAAP